MDAHELVERGKRGGDLGLAHFLSRGGFSSFGKRSNVMFAGW
jgi:hypothetical protein